MEEYKIQLKLAIIGSRSFNDYELLKETLNQIIKEKRLNIGLIISGGAKGADSLAYRYSIENQIEFKLFKAEWEKYGRAAGIRRDSDIINDCDLCIAFWDGKSRGTSHSISLCSKQNKECIIISIQK